MPVPDAVRDALEVLNFLLEDAIEYYNHFRSNEAQEYDLLRQASSAVDRANPREVAWHVLRTYFKARALRHTLNQLEQRYGAYVGALSSLMQAVGSCNIRHDDAEKLYVTLDEITIWMGLQTFLFYAKWQKIPEHPLAPLKNKVNLLQAEVRAFRNMGRELRRLLRQCRLKGPDKIIPVHPRPNRVLEQFFRKWQMEHGWVVIPATLD